ncbi:GIY-YIG nuclease family protein [Phaeobacter gallaeciensis]|uniref:GIY-YIG nuclease family protein n=1 Tax=Phaeobacter gallaeciensis TaxID=60890 RepID=UPI000BBC3B1D|nr:GIY-YIG nuclease family protein [Phaeobacter gallaeciensis]ATF17100.1 T5domain protein [Phaeobacter gallaeciensis]ATF21209.1 T5domain protein [Phaeobacter gallaeciensis]
MPRPTLDDIFAEPDEFGLLQVAPQKQVASKSDGGTAVLSDVTRFFEQHGRLPDPDAEDHEEMRLGTIWDKLRQAPTQDMLEADRLGLLTAAEPEHANWRDEPTEDVIPDSLDDIFADDDLEVPTEFSDLRHVTPSAERHQPEHRAEFVPCQEFDQFEAKFSQIQAALEAGERKTRIVEKWAIIEPVAGDVFIRNGLLCLVVERMRKSSGGLSQEDRLRIVLSNGTESDPMVASFRKALNDDKTARSVQKVGLGPLDPEWEADQLAVTGIIYVAKSMSDDPNIRPHRDILHKIGVTSQDVKRRVADAKNDPTFLLAPVEIVATYRLGNLPRERVEKLLHRFFEAARPAKLTVPDRFGNKMHHPKEWFFVLPEHVSHAAALIREGRLHEFWYDPTSQKISPRTKAS